MIAGLAAIVLGIAPSQAGLIFHADYDTDPHSPVGSRTGTLQNSAQIFNGMLGGTGIDSTLNGSNQFVKYNNGIPVSGSAIRKTSVWVKSSGAAMTALGFGANQNGQKWELGFDANEKISIDGSNAMFAALGAPAVNDGNWHLLTAVLPGPPNNWVGGTWLYVDGEFAGARTLITGSNRAYNTSGTLFHVGAGVGSGSGSKFLSGLVDDAAVWDRILSGTEIRALSQLSTVAGLNAIAADALFEAFNTNPRPETVEAGGQTWHRHDSGIGGADGEVQQVGENFSVNLGGGAGYVSGPR